VLANQSTSLAPAGIQPTQPLCSNSNSSTRRWFPRTAIFDLGDGGGKLAGATLAMTSRNSLESTIYLTMAGLILVVNVLKKSYALSLYDNATHLPARKYLRRDVGRMKSSYAFGLVGIDDFKTLHDRYGRDASDRVTKKIANNLRKASASAFRYSGVNFMLVFAGRGATRSSGTSIPCAWTSRTSSSRCTPRRRQTASERPSDTLQRRGP